MIVAVNRLPSVFDTTASTLPPLVAVPVVWIVPLLTSVSLLPCMYTAGASRPFDVNVPLLVIVPLPPSSDAARALLPEVVTVPVLTIWLPDAPVALSPRGRHP